MPICHIYNTKGDELKKFDTDDYGKELTIGRSSKCDVCLKLVAANNVSRTHIRLRRILGDWLLVSEGHSGVFKDGKKIQESSLREGDIYRFSQLFLCVGKNCGPSPFDVTWEEETEDGTHRAVLWPGVNTIGASHDNYVTVRTPFVSRFHAQIILSDDNRLTIENLYETVFTSVNDVQVLGVPKRFQPGDSIVLGETEVKVERGFRLAKDATIRDMQIHRRERRLKQVAKTPIGWLVILVIVITFLSFMLNFFLGLYQMLTQ